MASDHEIRLALTQVRGKLRITKVVATRSVKTKSGDFFAGMSAAWDSVQDDAGGPGADLDLLTSTSAVASSGMSLLDARLSSTLLAMEATTAAWRAALIEGAITDTEFETRTTRVRRRASDQISAILDKANPQSAPPSSQPK